MGEHVDRLPDGRPAAAKVRVYESTAERAARREAARAAMLTVAANLRTRAKRQRIQATFCLGAIAVLLAGGGAFFYFAQTIALSELKAQSEFVARRRKTIDEEIARVKTDNENLIRLGERIAALAANLGKLQHRQIGWTSPNGSTLATQQLAGVHFPDTAHGCIVGAAGTILTTADSGATWQKHDASTTANLTRVYFADVAHGWTVGDNGTILGTTDGGLTWKPSGVGTANFAGVYFLDANQGWVVGQHGIVLATQDGGLSWKEGDSHTRADLASVYFADRTHGWVVGANGTIRATADAGLTWNDQDSKTGSYLLGVWFANAEHGWAVGNNGTILATIDGGATWQPRESPAGTYLFSVQFVDIDHGWAFGGNGTIVTTADRGVTWQKRDSGLPTNLYGAHFADATHGWAVSSPGEVLMVSVPEVKAVAAARQIDTMQAALQAIGVSEQAIGQPLVDFRNAETDRNERQNRITQDEKELLTVGPTVNDSALSANLLSNPMFLSNLNRIGVTIYAFFAISIVIAVYRYCMRLNAHYSACADALELSEGGIDARFHQLVRSLSPVGIDFGKTPRSPVDQSADILRSALRADRRV